MTRFGSKMGMVLECQRKVCSAASTALNGHLSTVSVREILMHIWRRGQYKMFQGYVIMNSKIGKEAICPVCGKKFKIT